MAVVVDAEDRVQGIFTDGDLRRLVESGRDLRALTAAEVATPRPAPWPWTHWPWTPPT